MDGNGADTSNNCQATATWALKEETAWFTLLAWDYDPGVYLGWNCVKSSSHAMHHVYYLPILSRYPWLNIINHFVKKWRISSNISVRLTCGEKDMFSSIFSQKKEVGSREYSSCFFPLFSTNPARVLPFRPLWQLVGPAHRQKRSYDNFQSHTKHWQQHSNLEKVIEIDHWTLRRCVEWPPHTVSGTARSRKDFIESKAKMATRHFWRNARGLLWLA